MKVPPEILAVERPKNTVVFPYGKNKDRYGVRTRKGCIYDKGRRKPINGEVIGHIVNGAFVPKEQPDSAQIIPVSHAPVDLKDWGTVILCDRVCSSLLTELESIYAREDAVKIYCCAILRVCVPGITDSRLKDGYEECWLSELYPGVSLSKNVISDFWHSLGRAYSRINKFMLLRVDTVEHGDHLLVDGTLKSNESRVNSLSDFSRKARTKGTKDISLLYAFDLEKQEPICCKCFSGGTVDSVAYDAFISENKITKGIIVGDKGFPSSVAAEQFAANKNLHYLNPLKRNSKFIKDYNLHEYEGQLETDSCILYKRVYVERVKKWLYAFRDTRQAHKEDYSWLDNALKKGTFSSETYVTDGQRFGTILLESDYEMTPELAFKTYSSRWEIEVVMRYYKQTCEFDETRVHNDYSVIGSEFCNFLAVIMTYRLIKTFDAANLFKDHTYKRIMQILRRAKRVHLETEWVPTKLTPSEFEVLKSLDLTEGKSV